ncbi:speckle-type POZ protein B-like [Microplitis mediator]|uniref:speckle-type POZ protein B-like n=1 Tax=Microplitis mediator TaxID=375433 RepID=UPI002554E113|nr:speckle-type POZ protein B-like [Microplitis mediator]
MEILGYSHCEKHQVMYKWKVNEITSLIECSKKNHELVKLKSFQFRVNAKTENLWYLLLRIMNDGKSGQKEWISLYLGGNIVESKIRIKYSLFILDNKDERQFIHTYYSTRSKSSDRGCSQFLEIKQLLENENDFLTNDTLTICVELTVYDDYKSFPAEFQLQSPKRQRTDDLRELYDSKTNSDVILAVGDKIFKAHKLILSARSPVFFAMFTHEMKEKKENTVTISDIDPEIFEKILKFIYTDNIDDLDADAECLLELADKYQLLELKRLCEESLSKSVSIDNAIQLMILADLHNADKLLEFIFEFIIRNFKDVVKTPEYELHLHLDILLPLKDGANID